MTKCNNLLKKELLYNLMYNSVSKNTDINITLKIETPVDEFFRLVETTYGINNLKQCIELIVENISIEDIKKALTDYLMRMHAQCYNRPLTICPPVYKCQNINDAK